MILELEETKTQRRKRERAERLLLDPVYIEKARLQQERGRQKKKYKIRKFACSEPWLDAVMDGQPYAPSFKCQCSRCREYFWSRLEPEPARESLIGIDCQGDAQAPDEDQIRGMAKTMLMVMSEDEVVEKILSIFPELEMEFVFPGRQKFYGGTVFIPAKRNAGTIRRRKPILDWDNPT